MLERFVWFKQSGFLWRGEGLIVYIDPWGVTQPDPADVVFITHAHFDHFSMEDIEQVRKDETVFVAPRDVAAELSGNIESVQVGDSVEVAGIKASVVPAYNIMEQRLDSHPQRNGWVGYVMTLGSNTYYHAGDTDHLPELDQVRADVTFLPIGGDPFTMDPLEAGGLARAIGPEVAVPMHYGFVAGSEGDGTRFVREAAPVRVELLTPENPFER